MRPRLGGEMIALCIVLALLSACTPSPTATSVAVMPTLTNTAMALPTPAPPTALVPTPSPTVPPPTATPTHTPTSTSTSTLTSTPDPTSTPLPRDVPPVVNIVAPLEALVGDEVILDASATFDWDGDDTEFSWVQFHNPDRYTGTEYVTGNDTRICDLEGQCAKYPKALSGSEQVKFVPEWPGNYRFVVTASDKDGVSEKKVDVLVKLAEPLEWEFKGASAGVSTWGISDTSITTIGYRFDAMKNIGIDSYEISTAWFMDGYTDNNIVPIYDAEDLPLGTPGHVLPTVTDERLIEVIEIAQERGLKVYLRPTLEAIANDSWNWRGNVHPENEEVWWNNYRDFLSHYAKIAAEEEVYMFSIGFEMDSRLPMTHQWIRTIDEVRSIYSGLIAYDCAGLYWLGEEESFDPNKTSSWLPPTTGDFLHHVDRIGIDWYPSLAGESDASVSELRKSVSIILDSYVEPVYREFGKPIHFGEIDYSSLDKTTVNPLMYRTGTKDITEQTSAYEAVFSVLQNKIYFSGMFPAGFFLKEFFDPQRDSTIWNKPAMDVFELYYEQ